MKRFLSIGVIFLLLCTITAIAQPVNYPIAQGRQLQHYNLDKIQKQFMGIDGKPDDVINIGYNEEVNLQLTYAAGNKIDQLQKQLELDSTLNNSQKQTYLRGLGEMLQEFISAKAKKKIKIIDFPETLKAWEQAYLLDRKGLSIAPLMGEYPSATGNILLRSGISFLNNPGIPAAKNRVVLKYIEENPTKVLSILSASPDVPFADSLIAIAAKKEPEKLYSYAQAGNTKFGRRIQKHPDPVVKLLCDLADDNSGRLYFPFLDNLAKGIMTIDDVKKEMRDTLSYYRLLVKTQIGYAGRMAKGDTPMVAKSLNEMIHNKAVIPFVNTINGLHDVSNPVIRFKKIEPLTAQELYYLIVSSEAEIYTSSYTNTYDRIWQRMAVPNADTLLASVNRDHYKKFITMAANYNKLDDFLNRMSKSSATALMTSFVNNLDKGTGSDLEDAVDVANSYASIRNDTIKRLMLEQINKNYATAINTGNSRGQIIYRLEKLILSSSDSGSNINLTDSLGILPVFEVKNNYLRDDSGRIVLQMYFYGDDAGRGSLETLKRLYTNKNWKRTDSPEWVMFTSINTPVPFVILANKAGYEEKDEDALAQQHLNEWMDVNNYKPSITVHRGHSYYLPYTIKQLAPSSKVVVLGSCGAYHSLKDILEICKEPYIIASKQTGFGEINVILFTTMIEELKNGNDINWESFWKILETKVVRNKEGFDDYIPPYKNLGAIFINAYSKATEPALENSSLVP
ncbi:MAG: hypothetical protein V4722_04880 [Bacteroidota bacterium]